MPPCRLRVTAALRKAGGEEVPASGIKKPQTLCKDTCISQRLHDAECTSTSGVPLYLATHANAHELIPKFPKITKKKRCLLSLPHSHQQLSSPCRRKATEPTMVAFLRGCGVPHAAVCFCISIVLPLLSAFLGNTPCRVAALPQQLAFPFLHSDVLTCETHLPLHFSEWLRGH